VGASYYGCFSELSRNKLQLCWAKHAHRNVRFAQQQILWGITYVWSVYTIGRCPTNVECDKIPPPAPPMEQNKTISILGINGHVVHAFAIAACSAG